MARGSRAAAAVCLAGGGCWSSVVFAAAQRYRPSCCPVTVLPAPLFRVSRGLEQQRGSGVGLLARIVWSPGVRRATLARPCTCGGSRGSSASEGRRYRSIVSSETAHQQLRHPIWMEMTRDVHVPISRPGLMDSCCMRTAQSMSRAWNQSAGRDGRAAKELTEEFVWGEGVEREIPWDIP